jgi:hypothetical protein
LFKGFYHSIPSIVKGHGDSFTPGVFFPNVIKDGIKAEICGVNDGVGITGILWFMGIGSAGSSEV